MRPTTLTVSGPAAADILRRLANRYAHCTLKGRLHHIRMYNEPWSEHRTGRPGGYKAWNAQNEEERRSYRDALQSIIGELPDVVGDPVVPATKANGLSYPMYSYDRARKIAAEYETAIIALTMESM